MLSTLDKDKSIITVTSSVPGEGKTTVAINLAHSIQQMKKTLLIDADMRRPMVHRAKKIEQPRPGLAALVTGEATFEEATLAEVMEFVTMTAKKLSNGEVKPGLVIRGGDAVRDRSLTFKIGAVPLDTLIETVASLTNTTVKYTDYAITFTSLPSAADIAVALA